MTLIIAVGTGDRVVHVSDRRMTWNRGRYDDTANKAVVVECADGAFVLGYTGLGRIGLSGPPTDVWAVEALAVAPEKSQRDAVDHLASRAAEAIGPPAPGDDLCFMGAGFQSDGRQVVFTVSNVHDECGRYDPPKTPCQ